MCFGGPKVDNTIQRQQMAEAEAARKREEERQARINEGTSKINDIFGAFTPDYYKNMQDNYMGFYQPQLDDQFKQAGDQLTYSLARAGTLNSTLAAQKQAQLKTKYDTQRASILSQAKDAVAQQQSTVAGEKSALVSQLNATGNADAAANEATNRTQQMFGKAPSYNPLGDIFAGFSAGIGNGLAARQNTQAYNAYFGSQPNNTRIV